MSDHTYFPDLLRQAIPEDGILSRSIHDDAHVRAVLFAFAAGQELSDHTASTPAVMQILQGEAHLTLGDDAYDAQAGTWVHMPAKLPHSVRAITPTLMLLLLLKTPR